MISDLILKPKWYKLLQIPQLYQPHISDWQQRLLLQHLEANDKKDLVYAYNLKQKDDLSAASTALQEVKIDSDQPRDQKRFGHFDGRSETGSKDLKLQTMRQGLKIIGNPA